ncbi:unnamed protein product [Prorocentrum cordatum]|uniref:LicD/FKTN/FKRP nucleotidyltransferase domain-containing protein n=1 Tax=Prorocentrum cordatum TaxID=2364126 RepID=A0ABN9XUP0_9DINO|nr:unnamed protein product [Polarella glacialis]
MAGGCVLVAGFAAYALVQVGRLSRELGALRDEAPRCRVDGRAAAELRDVLGVAGAEERLEHFETLLRLASREPQFSYGSAGGYPYDSYGRGGSGGRARDSYGYGYDRYGYERDYYGGPGEEPAPGDLRPGSAAAAAAHERELSLLPTTQGLSCRSPRCERNASLCARGVGRSLATPYGCCSDYMLLMLTDVTEWLTAQQIPYFVTYGTLLGALRDNDILPWTQDVDIVVDRSHWPQLQRGLEAADFFGGRRYMFGVDQWEERVSRVCADWEGFAASVIGGPDGDRFTRGTEFHLDVYASDWWQIKDLHLVDCVEPLGTATVPIRGRNFSAPARPRACVEKLYGADWRTPKRALSGVN